MPCRRACRRLTPNFKIRAEVGFNTRCSFPLTLKVYVITQQEKDSVPEWVPDDFLDPDLPQVCTALHAPAHCTMLSGVLSCCAGLLAQLLGRRAWQP